MLSWGCPLNHGRTAFIPESNILVSVFKVMKEDGDDTHLVKIITSGATIKQSVVDEEEVASVTARELQSDKSYRYLTVFTSGEHHWLPASSFIDDDGTITLAWLAFVGEQEIQDALRRFTKAQLRVCYMLAKKFA